MSDEAFRGQIRTELREATSHFDPDVASVRAARRFAQETADRWGLEDCDMALVVAELAANAVVHGRSPFTVSLRRDQLLSIEVSDRGPTVVSLGPEGDTARSGRGLQIVDRLASDWGIRPFQDGGKVIWARLER